MNNYIKQNSDKFKNKLIIFDSEDHTGKSTVVKQLYNNLNSSGIKTIKTFQPGDNDGEYNDMIRDMCKTKKYNLDPLTNMFAFLLDRSENTIKIKKYLDDGYTVLADRWWHSTIAYQFYGKEILKKYDLNKKFAYWLNKVASHNLIPDYAFYLHRPEKELDENNKIDLFETETDLFKKRVDKAYKKMVKCGDLTPIEVNSDTHITISSILAKIGEK